MRTAIIFSNRKTTVRDLASELRRDGFAASQIHGDMEQAERIRELDRFKAGEINILVASDVAARGLDIKGVSHVFNYDVPWHPDDYVHRIGRTGRAGATGKAYTLATPDDAEAVAAIEKLTGFPIPRIGSRKSAEPAPAEPSAEPAAEAPAPARRDRNRKRDERPREERAPRAARTDPAPAAEPETEDRPARAERAPREDRAERAPREDRPERAPREDRPERAPREDRPERAPREDRPVRAPEARAEPRRDQRRDRRPDPDGPDDGWNGPVPSFLDFGFGTTGTPKP